MLALLRQQFALTADELASDDISVTLNTLIIGAARDKEPRHTLQSIHQAVLAHGLVPEIDVFTAVPLLLESAQETSDAFLDAIAGQCSAKEMIIVLQEFSERLKNSLDDTDDTYSDNDEDEDKADRSDTNSQQANQSQQVIRIVTLYGKVIPRLSEGKKTPSQILYPPLTQLQEVLLVAAPVLTENDVDLILRGLNKLILATLEWAGGDQNIKNMCYTLVTATLQAFGNKLGTGVANRAFEEQFPRLRRPNRTTASQAPASRYVDPIAEISQTLQSIGIDATQIQTETPPSIATLIFLAHSPSDLSSSRAPPLHTLTPLILASLQTNTALPSTLALLLRTLRPLISSANANANEQHPLSNILPPLTSLLPQIASHHPDPLIRHITFRLLSLVLALTPPIVRMHILRDLASPPSPDGTYDESNESMAVASVGLIKESVLAALSPSGSEDPKGQVDVFATTTFTDVFLPVLFPIRFPPPESHHADEEEEDDAESELSAFLSSSEPSRLVEVLGLYYLLLRRDAENRTGIPAPDVAKRIETTCLEVLRAKLGRWNHIDLEDAEDAKMQLGILEMWLDRIEEALVQQ